MCGGPKRLEQDSSCFHLWFANRGHRRVRALDGVTRMEVIHHLRNVSPALQTHMQPGWAVSENKRLDAR